MREYDQNNHAKTGTASDTDKRESLDTIIILFLFLSIFLPAIVSIFHGYWGIFYWKAIALYFCASISLLLFVVKWIKYKEKPVDMKTHLPIAILFLSVIISSVSSKYGFKVLLGSEVFYEGALTLISYYIIFITFKYYVTSSEKLQRVFYWILFSGAFLYFYSWIQVIFKTDFDTIFTGGTFGHRNYMASYYTLLLIPAVALYFYAKSNKEKIIYYFLSCIFFSTLIIVHTRSSWVGNTIGFILFLILARKKISFKKASILIASFIIIVITINSYYNGLIFLRFNKMVDDAKQITTVNTQSSINGNTQNNISSDTQKNVNNKANIGTNRYGLWSESLKLVPNYFLFGAGPDMFSNIFPQEEAWKMTGQPEIYYNAHNEYLGMILTIGIFAFIAYIWLIVIIIIKFVKLYKKLQINTNISFLYIGIFCAWCSYLVQALFNNSVIPTSPTLWAIMGILSNFSVIFNKVNVETNQIKV